MKHEHITPNDPRWNPLKYICVCGFTTGDRVAFDDHLKEKSNEPDLLEACKKAKKHLEPDLVEPGRTVFWELVNAIAKAEGKEA